MEPLELLNRILHTYEPKTIVCCGKQACRVTDDWSRNHPDVSIATLSPNDPNAGFPLPVLHDLALVSDTLEHLPQAEGKMLLGQLRNAGARRIAVLVEAEKSWRFADFIGLGFKRVQHIGGDQPQTLYAYDIASYNHKRKWNNPDNWANPEMWDKARW
jgi:hypothetical protein